MLKLKPTFKEMVWGGNRLQSEFGFNTPSNHTGEAWVVSAHPEGPNQLEYQNRTYTLNNFYSQYREQFGKGKNKTFPIMIKIIDAASDLSVQVHPNDDYALKYENSYGKTESWYILDCPVDHKMIMGHHAKNRDEYISKLRMHQFDDLFRTIRINKGDCFDVSAGTIHAICKNTLVYEVQQNSNVTYRIFDYDRIGLDGNKRELHIEKSIDVSIVPSAPNKVNPKITPIGDNTVMNLVSNDYFDFSKVTIVSKFQLKSSDYFAVIGVESGNGTINNQMVQKGDHYIILPQDFPVNIHGQLSLFIIFPKAKSMD